MDNYEIKGDNQDPYAVYTGIKQEKYDKQKQKNKDLKEQIDIMQDELDQYENINKNLEKEKKDLKNKSKRLEQKVIEFGQN